MQLNSYAYAVGEETLMTIFALRIILSELEVIEFSDTNEPWRVFCRRHGIAV
jgi:hypothetical protein